METQFTTPPKPNLVNAIAWMTLASGVLNLIWGLVATISLSWTIICMPFAILPAVLGIFEVIYAAKLMSNPPQPVQPSTSIAILEIICILAFNVFSLVVGILALVFYNDITVRNYFARLNGTLPPEAPVPPIVPPPAPQPEPAPDPLPEAPVTPAEVAPPQEPPAPMPEEPPAPAPEEAPAKPKRSRKVAGK